jgi:hypothetical protein
MRFRLCMLLIWVVCGNDRSVKGPSRVDVENCLLIPNSGNRRAMGLHCERVLLLTWPTLA